MPATGLANYRALLHVPVHREKQKWIIRERLRGSFKKQLQRSCPGYKLRGKGGSDTTR